MKTTAGVAEGPPAALSDTISTQNDDCAAHGAFSIRKMLIFKKSNQLIQ